MGQTNNTCRILVENLLGKGPWNTSKQTEQYLRIKNLRVGGGWSWLRLTSTKEICY